MLQIWFHIILTYITEMVKLKAFEGLLFKPQLYQQLLTRDIENIQGFKFFQQFNSQELIKKQLLVKQKEEFMYLYQQQFMGLTTLGVLAQISLQEYKNNNVKKHQKTLKNPNFDKSLYQKQHIGPVVVGYQHEESIDQLLQQLRDCLEPYAVWQTVDGRKHKLWRIQNYNGLIKMFSNIDSMYILDGHHRFKAAANLLSQTSPCRNQKLKWIQGLIYSSKYIRVYSQYRKLVHQNFEEITKNILQNRKLKVNQSQISNFNKSQSDFGLIYNNKFYQVCCMQQLGSQKNKLPVQKLDDILAKSFKNFQQNQERPIEYVPSLKFNDKKNTDNYPIFLFKPPSINKIFQLVNKGEILPSKTTWLEPKPCLHMVIRLPY